ncbi:MerR family transcriptional regulator [Sphaerisporangium perillae]|uniref:MerR family transcriptional regulator n=1 Tax=Sphaerisporangium perillae TaxID=2935860 RepID=UPI00200CF00D|nr:MerR family transcriptional regulator [Sphaerisporangium perillae]
MDEGITIAEVAHRTGLTAHTLRYYERAGLLPSPPPRGTGGHRSCTKRDLDWVVLPSRLRTTGMSIADMRRYAEPARDSMPAAAQRLELPLVHRAQVAARIEQLRGDLALIDRKIQTYRESIEEHTR